ncbi:hypothetical protein PTKIN_Ptkin16aG0518500 [Pterospermum kingtungense]
MAEAIVSLAVRRISDLLIHEAVSLGGVGAEVERLKAELDRMNSVLNDAEYKQEQTQLVRTLVKQIRDLSYEAEDVIDSFILHQVAHQGVINRFTSIFTKPFHRFKAGKQIKAIQTRIEDISKSLPAYDHISGGQSSASGTVMLQQWFRRTYSHVEEEDVVSLEGLTKIVLAQLKREDEDRPHVVVSLVGMGGIGKTTLAKKVYNHNDLRHHFDCLAWAFISQKCSAREVLLEVLTKVHPLSKEERELGENELKKILFDFLKEKRYLVVLDDIWRIEDWNILKPAFPRGKKGSKILFTTRNKDVALLADPRNSPIELPFLSDDDSWRLFKRKAFLTHIMESDVCLEEFEMLGREMVKKCGGLPLAIVMLGGLLATKGSRAQWEKVQRNIHAHINKVRQQDNQYGAVNGILVLSYNDLPHHLKPCFLYLGHYPEDWEISTKELIRLWIAEGFISPSIESRGILMEDIGEQFLEELIARCLLQVGKMDSTGRCVKTCRIHDILRDLCIDKAREENFLEIIQPSLISPLTLSASMPRRIAIHPSKRYVCLEGGHPKLRSLLLFNSEELIELPISNCKIFKLLRVLNLVRKRVDLQWQLSSEIGNLHHLRYLGLFCLGRIIFPQSIGKLQNLHTLRVQAWGGIRIPNVVFKLERLRHILLFDSSYEDFWRGTMMHFPMRGGLKCIETLKYIRIKRCSGVLSLTSIRSLGVIFERSEDVEPILKAVVQSNHLRKLHLRLLEKDPVESYSDLEPLSQCHHLSKLLLYGKIKEDPRHDHHVLKFVPPNIVKLTLYRSEVKLQDPMVVLEKLPHLRVLCLFVDSYRGTKMKCSANGFPQLDSLWIRYLHELEEWEIDEGAMPRLRSLYLFGVAELRKLPEGLRYLTALEEMKLDWIKRSLVERIQVVDGRQGEDFSLVSHIPSIQIGTIVEDLKL